AQGGDEVGAPPGVAPLGRLVADRDVDRRHVADVGRHVDVPGDGPVPGGDGRAGQAVQRQVGVADQVEPEVLGGGAVVVLAGELDEAPAPPAAVVARLDGVDPEPALVAERG